MYTVLQENNVVKSENLLLLRWNRGSPPIPRHRQASHLLHIIAMHHPTLLATHLYKAYRYPHEYCSTVSYCLWSYIIVGLLSLWGKWLNTYNLITANITPDLWLTACCRQSPMLMPKLVLASLPFHRPWLSVATWYLPRRVTMVCPRRSRRSVVGPIVLVYRAPSLAVSVPFVSSPEHLAQDRKIGANLENEKCIFIVLEVCKFVLKLLNMSNSFNIILTGLLLKSRIAT